MSGRQPSKLTEACLNLWLCSSVSQSRNVPDNEQHLEEFIAKGAIIIHMDNILIFSWTKEQHHVVVLWSLPSSNSIVSTSKWRNACLNGPQLNTLASSSWK